MRDPLKLGGTPESIETYRSVVRTNVADIRDAYRKRARWHRRMFRTSGIAVIVLSASLPLLAGLSYDRKNATVAFVGLAVAILTGLRSFYQWDQAWGLLRQSDFALSHLLGNWEIDVAAADALPDSDRASTIYHLSKSLLEAADRIRQGESQKFFGALRFPGGTTANQEAGGARPQN